MTKEIKTMEHILFGRLRYLGAWTKLVKLTIFGRECSLMLLFQGDDQGVFDHNQVLAYQGFFDNLANRIFRIERAAFRYYEVMVAEFRAALPDPQDAPRLVPEIKRLEELYPLVTPLELVFPKGRQEPTVGFLADSAWDHQGGLAVRFEGDALVEVGTRDILL